MIEITVDRNFDVIKDIKETDEAFEDPYLLLGKILASSFMDFIKENKEA
ncbi:MAG: hypothetical protein RIN55_05765 [Tissierellaceae bacterium]|nr:hypothetical protein [Tissierellaceae bacterium]